MPTPTAQQLADLRTSVQNSSAFDSSTRASALGSIDSTYGSAPTVITNANTIENTIPNIVSGANKYLGTNPTTTSTTGNTTGADNTDNTTLNYLLGEQTTHNANIDTGYSQDKSLLDSMKSSQDAAFNMQLQQIDSFYSAQENQMKADQANVNKGLGNLMEVDGTNRTSDESGILSAKRTYDIKQLTELHNEELRARLGIMTAKNNNDYQSMAKNLELAQKARKDKQDFADKIIAQQLEQQKTQREQKQKALDDINKLSVDAAKNGAPKEILDKINSSKSLSEAVANAGEYMQNISGAGIVAEYNYYKKDAIARGQVPLSFDEYQTRDANRKVSIAKAGSATGLDSSTLSKVETVASKFGTEQAVKNYQVAAEAIEALKTAGTSPTDDQSRIYAFAKVMDPNSVVRESEYATVQDYSQALFQKLGFKVARVFSNTGFLTDEARKMMEKTLKNRLSASEGAYKNIYNEAARKINKLTGKEDGSEYLTDYSKGFTSTQNEIINAEEEAKTKVLEYGKSNPDFIKKARPLLEEVQPELGRPMSYEEVLELYKGEIK
jgi:hypothetical protein